jgi:PE family/PPE-SVP subfamily C-terminal region
MSFVNTQPAAISAAATQLEGLSNSFAAESSAAASSTTDVLPAATDEVSVLQAGVFSTYGQLYQSVSAQAQAIHQQFVQLLNQSSGSYQDTESANQAGAAANALSNGAGSASGAASQAATDPISTLAGLISGLASTIASSPLSSNIGNLLNINTGNYASAASDMIGVTSGGLLTALSGPATASADIGGLGSALASDVGPAAAVGGGGMGAAPVLASAGAGSSIGGMSVPPSWAGGAAGMPSASAPVTLASQSMPMGATGGPTGSPGTMAGMPAVANGGRGGSSFGAPRYGLKPKVMPVITKPTLG